MTDRQLFKCAFISRCIDHGLTTPAEIAEHADGLRKQADSPGLGTVLGITGLGKLLGGIGSTGKEVATGAWDIAAPLAIAGPPIVGGAAGWALAKSMDSTDATAEEMKKRELIDEYRRQTGRLRRKNFVYGGA
jgi:hypothetical protein